MTQQHIASIAISSSSLHTQALLIINPPTSQDVAVSPFQKILGMSVVERSLQALQHGGVERIMIFAPDSEEAIRDIIQHTVSPFKAEIVLVPDTENLNVYQYALDKVNRDNSKGFLIMDEPLVIATSFVKQLIEDGAKQANTFTYDSNQPIAYINLESEIASTTLDGISSFNDFSRKIANKSVFMPSPVNTLIRSVHSKKDKKETESALLKSLIKPTDGWVSRTINRKISTQISRLIAPTGISPNVVTIVTLVIGLVTGVFMAKGGYFNFLIGAILFQLTSILDGVDGEIARMNFRQSDFGQWLDTIADNLTYVAALVGVIIGVYTNDAPRFIILAGYVGLAACILALASQYLYLIRFDSGGSLLNIQYDFMKGETAFDRFMQKAEILGRRDFFAFVFFLLGIAGLIPYCLVYVSIMATAVLGFSIHTHISASRNRQK